MSYEASTQQINDLLDNKIESTKASIESGASFEHIKSWKDSEGYTLLHLCAARGHTEACQFLLENNLVDIEAISHRGYTPLNSALCIRCTIIPEAKEVKEVIELLLRYGAKIPDAYSADNDMEKFLDFFKSKQSVLKNHFNRKNWVDIKNVLQEKQANSFIYSTSSGNPCSFLDEIARRACDLTENAPEMNQIKEILEMAKKILPLMAYKHYKSKSINYCIKKNRQDLINLFCCASELVLRDLLIDPSEHEISLTKNVIISALAGKLTTNDSKVQISYADFKNIDTDLFDYFKKETFKICLENKSLEISLNHCHIDIRENFNALISLEQKEFSDDIKLIVEKIQYDAQKSSHLKFGLQWIEITPANIASVLFSLAYGHAFVLTELGANINRFEKNQNSSSFTTLSRKAQNHQNLANTLTVDTVETNTKVNRVALFSTEKDEFSGKRVREENIDDTGTNPKKAKLSPSRDSSSSSSSTSSSAGSAFWSSSSSSQIAPQPTSPEKREFDVRKEKKY